MLGKQIKDPHKIESDKVMIDGIGLLPVTTVMAEEKTLQLAEAVDLESGLTIRGYEIHHGETQLGGSAAGIKRNDGTIIGSKSNRGNIWGTYLHGIFDNDEFRRHFIDRLRSAKGLEPVGKVVAVYELESAFDHLADVFRESVQMHKIYELMGL